MNRETLTLITAKDLNIRDILCQNGTRKSQWWTRY